jgi:hypothetical protein
MEFGLQQVADERNRHPDAGKAASGHFFATVPYSGQ